MSVNELLEHLIEMQRDGLGELPVLMNIDYTGRGASQYEAPVQDIAVCRRYGAEENGTPQYVVLIYDED